MTFGEPSEALGARRNLGLPAMAAVATTARPSRHTECLICISFSVTAPEQGGSAPEKLGVASNQIERRNRAARLPQTGEANPTTPSRLPPTDRASCPRLRYLDPDGRELLRGITDLAQERQPARIVAQRVGQHVERHRRGGGIADARGDVQPVEGGVAIDAIAVRQRDQRGLVLAEV